ncbi:MAG: pyrroloquinoline quinone-dependent dehydrogenase [Gemmatimonadetes bacterium]|uniref:Pyrroloquinoline quinone-dependent dehydrogenase n=1 Tax=Candidatus Kutchimonas denitrificans TaxID=3056748 RepID=A0AAE4ZDH7_9BACT|nr:pyrroloquinoline quinone-dependent dehydrogenase [Gemmatimonadota bacterium]NIR76390.1 pyrroloquinoline quinone-dependent dehydrogenase [Candidatus Kutchimonas denitrificans]NIS03200.1 pyrroloquinoline quinone-dependent dehydrogenase [Gemmatimonadota bacterium]NIT66373.1 pyrroloquinoline quinone-dependent dehydrogenase [Gemmatimonadota bacterium]NIU54452.1 PQQ-binding-like beta-propeller repeat protein [Gemmatimonadota bacterium]
MVDLLKVERGTIVHFAKWTTAILIVVAAIWLSLSAIGPPNIELAADGPVAGWPTYGGSHHATRYSPLTQIDRDNVRHLEIAWTYRTGDVSDGSTYPRRSSFEATPILFEGALYFSTPFSRVVALDPETGAELWTHDPGIELNLQYSESLVSRGVEGWTDTAAAENDPCQGRIFFATLDARLLALDAVTGQPCVGFGDAGQVDLKVGIGDVETGEYEVTSPPIAVGDVVIVGSAQGDNRRVEVEKGDIRGFDARSGALRWTFQPIPRDPASPGWDSWNPESARVTGAANAWAPLAADPERDLVLIPTGSAAPDFYGGERPGSNLFANSVVALRASTGELVWYFQTVHHDLWDYDVASQPMAVTVRKDGEEVPAVLQATKMGHIFILHRETGEPVFPVEERPVPSSDVAGEVAAPTQPFPTVPPPLLPELMTPDSAWGLTPWDRRECREKMERLRYDGIFTPPSVGGSLEYPSMIGGANWGSAALDPVRRLVVLNLNRFASWVRLIPRERWESEINDPDRQGQFTEQGGTPYGLNREGGFVSSLDMPCTPPPWGVLVAFDLDSGEKRWQVPLGTIRDIAPLPLPIGYGTPNLGGPIVTASGLVFIGAAMDDYLRAFDLETGEELWKGRLPAGGQATPMTYRLRVDGKQYVVIAAGGHGGLDTTLGDYLVAFALPN